VDHFSAVTIQKTGMTKIPEGERNGKGQGKEQVKNQTERSKKIESYRHGQGHAAQRMERASLEWKERHPEAAAVRFIRGQ
jgi:hypothetical protein